MTPSSNVIPAVRSMLLRWSGWTPEGALLAEYHKALGQFPLKEVEAAISAFDADQSRKTAPTARELLLVVKAARRRGLPEEVPYDPDCPHKTWETGALCRDGLLTKMDGEYEVAAGNCSCAAGRAR